MQVWDLTTALDFARTGNNFPGPLMTIPNSSTINMEGAYNLANDYYCYSNNNNNNIITNNSNNSYYIGGPTSSEMLKLLENCQIGLSSAGSSMTALCSERLTPAESMNSIIDQANL
ncbi:unnamed protein product [Trichobilharzia regenti]|nr:unnamed protein product [Trichobilharzia regenti]